MLILKSSPFQTQEDVFPQCQQHMPPATTCTTGRALHAVAGCRLAVNPLVTEHEAGPAQVLGREMSNILQQPAAEVLGPAEIKPVCLVPGLLWSYQYLELSAQQGFPQLTLVVKRASTSSQARSLARAARAVSTYCLSGICKAESCSQSTSTAQAACVVGQEHHLPPALSGPTPTARQGGEMLLEDRAGTAESRRWGFASAAASRAHSVKASTWLPLTFLSLQNGLAQGRCHAPLPISVLSPSNFS